MPARRRRAARTRRGRARARARPTPRPGWSASYADAGLDAASARLHGWTRRHSPRPARHAPGAGQHLGGDVLRPRPRPARRARPRRRRGRRRAVRARRRLVPRPPARPGRPRRLDRRPGGLAQGLHPLVDEVKRLGMDFGLWVEPEMVNEDSDLARAHPDWVLRGRGRLPARVAAPAGARPPGARRLRPRAGRAAARCSTEYDIAFLKWDHNRDLIDVAHDGRPAVHGQTLAFYRLLDELRGRASRPGDRDLRQRRRPDRPGGAHPHRPGLAERHHRRGRAAADPAVDLAAGAAGDARRPPRRPGRAHHRPHPPARASAPRPRCSATSASSGTCAGWTPTTAPRSRPGWPCTSGSGRCSSDRPAGARRPPRPRPAGHAASSPADAAEAWYVVATVDTLVTQSPGAGAAARARPGPDLPAHPGEPAG